MPIFAVRRASESELSVGAGLFALPKGVVGDWKSLRELFGVVEKTAEFGSAPIFAAGNLHSSSSFPKRTCFATEHAYLALTAKI